MEADQNWQDTLEVTLEVELARHPFALSLSPPSSYSPSPHRMSFTQKFQYCTTSTAEREKHTTWTRMRKTNDHNTCIPPIPQELHAAFEGQKDLKAAQELTAH